MSKTKAVSKAKIDTEILSEVHRLLSSFGLTISTAESCTGGLLSTTLTSMAGSSAYFKGGVVAYTKKAKRKLLGVKKKTIKERSVISSEVAKEMADGVRTLFGSSIGVGITGLAGPDGDSESDYHVGTVCIGLEAVDDTMECVSFDGMGRDRETVRIMAVDRALRMIYSYLTKSVQRHF